MKNPTTAKYNNLKTGTIIGIILPFIFIFIFSIIRFPKFNFIEFVQTMLASQIASSLISLAVLPNLGAFFICIKLKYDYTSRGILLATIIIATIGFIIYFAKG
jgi:hypothetical protein